MNSKINFRFLNSFQLKIIAVLLMTLDHIGLFFLSGNAMVITRSIGRLALPLFLFLSVDGLYHTRNPYKYSFTLFGLGFLMDIILFFFSKYLVGEVTIGNVFTLIGLGALASTLIRRKDIYSLLAVFPIAYATMASFTDIFSPYINCEYGLYGISMYLMFFLVYELVPYGLKKSAEKNKVDYQIMSSLFDRNYKNYICFLILFLHTAIFYLLYRINYTLPIIPYSFNIQSWCCIGGVFFLFFNGKKGYSHKLTKYAFYIYYPLHVVIFALIYALIYAY